MGGRFQTWWSWLTPPTACALCRAWSAHALCPSCRQDYARLLPRCPSCALPLAPGLALCVRCTESGPTPLQRCIARVPYAWPWNDIVAQFKFRSQPAWAREMARLMLDDPQATALLSAADGLIPIPLATSRLLDRGYNQAAELAKSLGRTAGRPAFPGALSRRETRREQHWLTQEERAAHAREAFEVSPRWGAHLRNRHWVLVDDVMTTGATLRAAALHLRAAGAASVSALVFARTPPPQATEDAAPGMDME